MQSDLMTKALAHLAERHIRNLLDKNFPKAQEALEFLIDAEEQGKFSWKSSKSPNERSSTKNVMALVAAIKLRAGKHR